MAKIYFHNTGTITRETEACKGFINSLDKELSEYEGKIWLIPGIDLHEGTGRHDIDVLMIGYLKDYYVDNIAGFDDIEIKSFFTTLEFKSHNCDGMYADGTHLWVRYPDVDEDVTVQSEEQKNSLIRYLNDPVRNIRNKVKRVTNLIFLHGVQREDFEEEIGLTGSNIITSDFSVEELFDAIGRQIKLRDQGFVDCLKSCTEEEIEEIANVFCARRDGADNMTLRRINVLQNNNGLLKDIDTITDQVIVLSGHAGTGKTIMLLQAADYLTRKGKKCLFLTYNNALIADLKHTIGFLTQRLSALRLETVHSYLISIMIRQGLWDARQDIEKDFLNRSQALLNRIKTRNLEVAYDYVFIDEAQDWERPIPEIMLALYKNAHVVIADGIDQFMRASDHTNWGLSQFERQRKCLRQRNNLAIFAKLFASKLGVYWDVEPNKKLAGGRVIITNKYDAKWHNEIMAQAKEHECQPYDVMFLAPNSMTEGGSFSHIDAYKNLVGCNLYDGTNPSIRQTVYNEVNAANKECRVYNYESCRGLEAWTTVCLRFHELFEKPHHHDYSEIEYAGARKYMLGLWSLIPLTRAVDTLVLVVPKDSEITKILKEIYEDNNDFITFDVN